METAILDRLTIGDIARECGAQPIHRIKYAIDTYDIRPRWRCGITRQWGRDDLPRIKSALARIAGKRELTHA